MSPDQRQHTRFSLDIPSIIYTRFGEKLETLLQQISIGGCFTDWEENIYPGDEFRIEIELPNKNRLPLSCKAVYRFENTGIGVKFVDISQFEQELVSKIISERLVREGLPIHVDPFQQPTSSYVVDDQSPKLTTPRQENEAILEKIMSGDDVV